MEFITTLVDWPYVFAVTVLTELLKRTVFAHRLTAAHVSVPGKRNLKKAVTAFAGIAIGIIYLHLKGCSLQNFTAFSHCAAHITLSFFLLVGMYDWVFKFILKKISA